MASTVAHALSAVVNISVVRAASPGSADKPSTGVKFVVGSGFVIDPGGIILTNQHVIEGAISIRVTFQDKSQYPAHLIAAASLVDLALLKVEVPHPLPTLAFGDSDRLRIGQPLIAIGNPIGVGTSVSTGSVSALNRNLMRTPFDDFIQTDAAINPGNSGGPLLDCAGKVVGMDTALMSNNQVAGSIGLGFAMPSDDVRLVARKLLNPHNMPNWIGIHLQDLTARLAMLFGRPVVSGAIVTAVDPGSPASEAALVPGDIITGAFGRSLPDSRAIMRAITVVPPGSPTTLSIWHDGATRQVALRGRPWPNWNKDRRSVVASEADIRRSLAAGLGVTLRSISEADRIQFHLGGIEGVLVDRVRPGSQADMLGIKRGDVIQQVGHQPARTPAQVSAALSYGKPDADDVVAALVHAPAGAKWVTFWVGNIRSPDLVTGTPLPQASPSTQSAAAQGR
ncbi:MAG TPA: trypsin-like peptidase domain-containing protein [Acetobacteraceae bacterium]|nr:trypsin-like peptidase domain-containing protein [Acetobacteraceae bacterium]